MLSDRMSKRVPLSEIDYADDSFRISEELDSERLRVSIVEVGQIHPVFLLARAGAGLVIVAGFRRLRALTRIGSPDGLAHIFAGRGTSRLDLFRLALWENLSHRQLNPLEVARALKVLREGCGLTEEVLARQYLPVFGLQPGARALHSCLSLNDLHPQLRQMVLEGRLTGNCAERLALMGSRFQSVMAGLLTQLRLSANLQRQVLERIDQIAHRDDIDPATVLENPAITAVLRDPGLSPAQRGERLHEWLHSLCHPRLSRAHQQFEAARKELELPAQVRIKHDPYFERPAIQIEFEASSLQSFCETADALQEVSRKPSLAALFGRTET
jgi:ParB-like chromosome segregation protein Spo0J